MFTENFSHIKPSEVFLAHVSNEIDEETESQ